ncbi:hypothetical protein E4631_23615 [Hymenobacter sp. UV11]|uniref:hypothetical protein n=1 Tax=Hymenobacter sp. UV11 TaxID=1849735 RepID=UPI00105E8829|nr:hypothetical protein [Hymenobacter sp. UV11]TFZ63135.1 hypothetical protein E4631_23615 [Hymenobacter sp. UV11]
MRGSLGTSAALLARAVGSLLLNKIIVLYGGPGSLAQLGRFQALMGLVGALPATGVQVGVTTHLPPLHAGAPRYRVWLGAAAWLTGLLVGVGALLVGALGGGEWPVGRTVIFGLAMLLVTGQSLLGAALLVAGRRGGYVALAVAIGALGLSGVGLMLVLGQPIGRVLLGYVVGQGFSFGLAWVLAIRAGLLRGWRPGWPSQVAVRGLLRFVLMAAGTQLFGQAIGYVLRAYLIKHYTPAATDLWQAVDKLSGNYGMVVAVVLGTVFHPRLAALAPQPAEQRRYVNSVAGLLAVGLALGLGLLFVVRRPLLSLLFAPRLAAAAPLLAPQLLGDWARFLGSLFNYNLLVRGRPGPYLAVQAGASVLYSGLLMGLVPRLGLPGVVDAYALHYWLLLIGYVGWYYRKGALARRSPLINPT